MRILVIEDEVKTAKFLKKGLGEAGFVVDVAGDGRDGLELAKTVEFDLIILDIMLPGLDGWQVLTGLRQAGTRAGAGLRAWGRRLPCEAICVFGAAGAGALARAPHTDPTAGHGSYGGPGDRSPAASRHAWRAAA